MRMHTFGTNLAVLLVATSLAVSSGFAQQASPFTDEEMECSTEEGGGQIVSTPRMPRDGRVNALIVFVQRKEDFYDHCVDTQGVPLEVRPSEVDYGTYCGATPGVDGPRYESWTDDPVTEWPAFELVIGDSVRSLPQWAHALIDTVNTPPANYTEGSLSHYYWLMSNGAFQLEGEVYPELFIPSCNTAECAGSDTTITSEDTREIANQVFAHIAANPHGIDFSQYDRYDNGTENYTPDGVFDMLIIHYRFGPAFSSLRGSGTLGGLTVNSSSGVHTNGSNIQTAVALIGHEIGHVQGLNHVSEGDGLGPNADRMSVMWSHDLAVMNAPDRIALGWVAPTVMDLSAFDRQSMSLDDTYQSNEVLHFTRGAPGEGDVIVEVRTRTNWWDREADGVNADGDRADFPLPQEGLYIYKRRPGAGNGYSSMENTGLLIRRYNWRPVPPFAYVPGDAFTPFSTYRFDFFQNSAIDRSIAITDIARSGNTFSFDVWSDFLREDKEGDKTLRTQYNFGTILSGVLPAVSTLARQTEWHLGGDFYFEDEITANEQHAFAFDPGATVTLGNGLPGTEVSINGIAGDSVRFAPFNPVLDPTWGGLRLAAADAVFDHVVIEGGATGLKVYDPGSGDLTNSEIRGSTVGLDVRSSVGMTVNGSTIKDSVTGVNAGFLDCYGPTCPCFTSCRGEVDLINSIVRDNAASGVFLVDGNADITGSEISDNGGYGLYVSNGLVGEFTDNLVIGNGANGLGNGLFVAASGDLFLSPSDDPGLNRVAHNNDEELYVYSSGFAFVGDASSNNGYNAIFDAGGGVLVANPTKPTVDANTIYWGTGGIPPSGAITGFVDTALPLACDPVSPPDPNDPTPCGQSRGTAPEVAALGESPGEQAERGGLGAEIRTLRAALAADPGSAEAAGLVRRLAALHRQDRADAEGERATSFGLLRALRARLNNPDVSSELRATAEAAVEAVVVDALTHERYEEAAGAIQAARERVEGAEVLRVLALAEASLEAHAGRYSEAASLAASVAASESEPSAVRGLSALAAHYADQASDGEGARGAGATAAVPLGAATRLGGAGSAEPGLAVYPNPLGGTDGSGEATVALTLDTASEARVVVYDVLGRQVSVLHAGELTAGTHAFSLDGRALPAGVYLVRVESGSHRFTERLTVVQ